MDKTALLFGGLLLLVSALTGFLLVRKKQTLDLMDRLNGMLEAAMEGSFEEKYFDESCLSAFEARLYQYLQGQAGKERKRKEEQREVHALIADISHQTKTPVANLILYAQLLEEQVREEETKDLARQVSHQAEKLKFLIDSLIKSSRLDQGIIQLNPQEHSVGGLLRQVLKMGEPLAQQKEVQLECRLEDGNDTAVFDPKWTSEALWNILDNAIKYTCPGDTVLLKGCAYELFYRIDVIDHGMGILEEEIPRLFQRFYRSGRVREEEGAGLGLYLAREIVRGQGGYIKAESKEETVFSVFLPRLPEHP